MKNIQLKNGYSIPSIGLGTWKIIDHLEMYETVRNAYDQGYRLFDIAAAYRNEIAFGKAVRDLLLPREELFIQDKLWNTFYGYEKTQEACKKTLRKLKLEYLDAYLVHWPASPKQYDNWDEVNAETWRGMEKLYTEGLVRTIGVCNFTNRHLEHLLKTAIIPPHINQIEFHPGMIQKDVVSYCKKAHIQLEASSPLGNGQVLANRLLCDMADKKNISTAQLCLKWAVIQGIIVLPKTTKTSRLKENMDLSGFELTEDEMNKINNLPFCGGLNIDPDEVTNFDGL